MRLIVLMSLTLHYEDMLGKLIIVYFLYIIIPQLPQDLIFWEITIFCGFCKLPWNYSTVFFKISHI